MIDEYTRQVLCDACRRGDVTLYRANKIDRSSYHCGSKECTDKIAARK